MSTETHDPESTLDCRHSEGLELREIHHFGCLLRDAEQLVSRELSAQKTKRDEALTTLLVPDPEGTEAKEEQVQIINGCDADISFYEDLQERLMVGMEQMKGLAIEALWPDD